MTYGDNSKPKAQTKEYDDNYAKIDWSNTPKKEEAKCKKKNSKKSSKKS